MFARVNFILKMIVFTNKSEIKDHISKEKAKGITFGFVPTMGALHNGHMSLVKRALQENNVCVVSVFVNPTQFDNPDDLEKYPRTLEEDTKLLETISNDILVYAPTVEDIYEGNTKAGHFSFDGLEFEMEGKTIHNYEAGILVKMTANRGRGLFANKAFKRGTLIAIDRAIAEGREDTKAMVCKELVDKLLALQAKDGWERLRLSYLFDNTEKELKVPKMNVFTTFKSKHI